MAAVVDTRAAQHSRECRERSTVPMLERSFDAARAAEGEARFAKGKLSSSGVEIVPRVSDGGFSGRGI